MLKIRLRRTGARHQPSYRVVVADSRAARDGAFVDYLGHYNPRTDPPTISIDEEKVKQLPDEKLCEMQRNGMLGACTAHSISLLNWSRVINRAMRQQSSDAVQQPQGGSDGPSLQI